VGAELGVFKGAFLDYLLSTNPRKLYAVDPWYRLSSEWPWAAGDKSTTKVLCAILKEYEPEIASRLLEPRVELSTYIADPYTPTHMNIGSYLTQADFSEPFCRQSTVQRAGP